MPTYPKIGYKKLIKFPNPKLQKKTEKIQIKIDKNKYCFFVLAQLFRKLNPEETAVVKIALKITKLYKSI